MSKNVQGTQVYFVDPADDSIVEIECLTNFNPGSNPADQVDDTCMAETTRKFKKGLRTPGQGTGSLKADPTNASHIRLSELAESDAEEDQDIRFAIGWSDGIGIAPTSVDSVGDFVLPNTRTWFIFSGYVADFPFDFQLGQSVETALAIQRSGRGYWIPKA